MNINNPITSSLWQLQKHEIVSDLVLSLRQAKKILGNNFTDKIQSVVWELKAQACQHNMSFFMYSWLLSHHKCENYETTEEFRESQMFIQAAIAYAYLKNYNSRYDLIDEDELRDID